MRTFIFVTAALLIGIPSTSALEPRPEMLVSTEWLSARLGQVKVIDIADQKTYAAGHIRGARLIEPSSLVTQRGRTPNELPKIDALVDLFTQAGIGNTGRVVIYSRDPILAARAWFTLDYFGQGQRSSVLDGGYAKWIDEERPIAKGKGPAVAPFPFEPSVDPTVVTGLKTMRELVAWRSSLEGRLVIIDARSYAQYCGEEAGVDVRSPGHIPGAENVPWNENLSTGMYPLFLQEEELRAIYESTGVSERSLNVVYCRTGMQAAVTYFVLKSLGYEASLYDGSYIEWSNARTELARLH